MMKLRFLQYQNGLFAECKGFAAFVGDVLPVAGLDAVFGEEFRAHADTIYSGFEPRGEVFPGWLDTTGHHEFGPGHRGEKAFDEFRAEDVAGEYLAQVAAGFLGETDLGDAAAAGGVGHKATVAYFGDFGVEQRAHHEACAELEVERGGGGVDNRAYAEGELGTFGGGIFDQFAENLVGEVTAVGELEGADAAVVACFHDLLGNLEVFVVEHGHHACGADFGQNGLFIEFCHNACAGLALYTAVGAAAGEGFDFFGADEVEVAVDGLLEG